MAFKRRIYKKTEIKKLNVETENVPSIFIHRIHIHVLIMISNNLMTTNNKMRKLTANGVTI